VRYTEKRGRISLSICVQEGFLLAQVKEARNLIPMDTNGLSDPYVRLKTSSCETNCNFFFLVSRSVVCEKSALLISKYNLGLDWDRTSRNNFMGSMVNSFRVSIELLLID
jgi:hypothetical protein